MCASIRVRKQQGCGTKDVNGHDTAGHRGIARLAIARWYRPRPRNAFICWLALDGNDGVMRTFGLRKE